MKTIQICAGCGMPVPADSPAGLCPECLLKSGAASATPAAESSRAHGGRSAPEPAMPIPGEMFGGYRIVRLLGHGGMGRVYEAEHVASGRRVALKVIAKALASDEDRKRFLREGRLAAAVNHPNVVYIHGSEEIDGVPVIAMELVHGGTLKDRLKAQGQLSIAEAVEGAIEIIDGLEAAHAAGVLHRDIKPANCFVSSDGTVKVGDFGLSVSTLARGESLLTATGAVMGTPAYASPEQLRGEELDVRSDIYSAGATLYHLLTGRTPFTSTDFVKLITEVLDQQPAPPHTIRTEIPSELSRIIVRCLAKNPKARFESYAELRDRLLPFCRADMAPARPWRRFCAGVIDDLIAYLPCLLFFMYWALDPLDFLNRERSLRALLMCLPFYVFYIAYYTITEGIWGAGVGKTLLGFRVVDAARQAPGLRRAMVRILTYMAPFTLPTLLAMAFVSKQTILAQLARDETRFTDWLWIPLTLALFITMRRRNGYAALQDLFSGTRVIVRPKIQPRPALESAGGHERQAAQANDPGAAKESERTGIRGYSVGPYDVRSTIWQRDNEELLLAHDAMLRRNVWIHLRPEQTKAMSARRRDLSRPARLRWLNHGTLEGRAWDAYEAPTGMAFLHLCAIPQRWRAVRYWLADLAAEIAATKKEPSTAAPLALDHLWVATNGQMLLLDFPAVVGVQDAAPLYNGEDSADAQRFLSAAAELALLRNSGPDQAAIPLAARQFLATLDRAAFDTIEFVSGNLESLIARPAEVTRARRVVSLAIVPAITVLISGIVTGAVVGEQMRTDRILKNLFPEKPSLRMALDIYERAVDRSGPEESTRARRARIYLAHHFRDVATNETVWSNPDLTPLAAKRPLLDKAIELTPAADSAELSRAERGLAEKMHGKLIEERMIPIRYQLKGAIGVMVCSLFVTFGVVLIFGRAPILHLLGIAVVGRTGQLAGRMRLLWRSVLQGVATLLCAVAAGMVVEAFGDGLNDDPGLNTLRILTVVVAPLFVAIVLGFAIWAARRPACGLHDTIAGTRLVPR